MNIILEVRTLTGRLRVNKSNEVCAPFGFLHGDKVITPFGQKATIMGVAPAPQGSRFAGQNVLWYQKEDGFTYYFGAGNLKELGFGA